MGENNQNIQHKEDNLNTKDFLIGALVGGIVGATTALLLTPKSGREIRHGINEQAQIAKLKTVQLKETATDYAGQAKQRSSDIARAISEQSSQVVGKVKEVASNVKEDVRNLRSVAAVPEELDGEEVTEQNLVEASNVELLQEEEAAEELEKARA
ncbi:YtxH domain-containing protein [Anaerobacillus sp. MEB173]|uniref:YtxH domain-containing protein n=1 Tax=Anaerobacillus sp. MEB173 TaxID=3383345 RepID=UPI003F9069E5